MIDIFFCFVKDFIEQIEFLDHKWSYLPKLILGVPATFWESGFVGEKENLKAPMFL